MTSEICVMNRTGVALAADSALSISNDTKIFNSANKLFELNNSLAMMIYGNANFNGVPWETIIKVFSNSTVNHNWLSAEETINDFITFINKNPTFFSIDEEVTNFVHSVEDSLKLLFDDIIPDITIQINVTEYEIDDKSNVEVFNKIIEDFINKKIKLLHSCHTILRGKKLYTRFKNLFEPLLKRRISEKIFFELSPENLNRIVEYAYLYLIKFSETSNPQSTGIVLAGFGEDDFFPHCLELTFFGSMFGKPKFLISKDVRIGNTKEFHTSAIIPFAQSEMINTILYGIDPAIADTLPYKLNLLLNDKLNNIDLLYNNQISNKSNIISDIVEEFSLKAASLSEELYVNPIIETVSSLPKEELSNMAETLVNLTSFKRRISTDVQNVGGPIDVALITKGDGFMWINKKKN